MSLCVSVKNVKDDAFYIKSKYSIFAACDIPSEVGTVNINSTCDRHGGSYICLFEYTGQLCDQCKNGYFDYNELSGCKGTYMSDIEALQFTFLSLY